MDVQSRQAKIATVASLLGGTVVHNYDHFSNVTLEDCVLGFFTGHELAEKGRARVSGSYDQLKDKDVHMYGIDSPVVTVSLARTAEAIVSDLERRVLPIVRRIHRELSIQLRTAVENRGNAMTRVKWAEQLLNANPKLSKLERFLNNPRDIAKVHGRVGGHACEIDTSTDDNYVLSIAGLDSAQLCTLLEALKRI